MFKWIIIFICIGSLIGSISAYNSNYKPLSKQIDVKTMILSENGILALEVVETIQVVLVINYLKLWN